MDTSKNDAISRGAIKFKSLKFLFLFLHFVKKDTCKKINRRNKGTPPLAKMFKK